MGGREWRAGARLWVSMALLAALSFRNHRPDHESDRRHQTQSRFAPADRHRVESGRRAQDGAAALSLPVPVLCRERQDLLPALSALGRHFPGRAVQRCVLCAPHADGGAGHGLRAGRVHPYLRRRPPLSQSSGAGAGTAFAQALSAARDEAQSGREGHLRIPLRRFQTRELQGTPAHQGSGGGVSGVEIHAAKAGEEKLVLELLRELAVYEKIEHKFHLTPALIARDFIGDDPVCGCDLLFVDAKPAGVMTWYRTYASFAAS